MMELPLNIAFIKIDRSSIVRNKDAGSTISIVPTGKEYSFSCGELPHDFIDGENIALTSWTKSERSGKIISCSGIILDNEFAKEKYIEDIPGVTITVKQNYERLYHKPIPLYSYKYLDARFRCKHCESVISYNTLQSNEYFDSDGIERINYTVCPECELPDCVDLVYEKIEDVVNAEKYDIKNGLQD